MIRNVVKCMIDFLVLLLARDSSILVDNEQCENAARSSLFTTPSSYEQITEAIRKEQVVKGNHQIK